MSSIWHNFGVATLGRVATNLLGLIIVGILTRALGPERFGDYQTIFAYLFLFTIIADMGLYTLLVRDISREGSDERRITGLLFTLRLFLVLGVAIVGSILVWWLPYTELVQRGVVMASLSLIFSSLVQVLMGVFQKHLKLIWVTIADLATRAVQLIGIFVLVREGNSGVMPFIAVAVAAGAVQLVLTIWFARRLIPFSLEVDIPYWKRTMRTAFPIAASLLFTLVYFKIDTVMLSFMRSSSDVGVYSVAYKVLEIIIFFPAMYIGLVMPLLSRAAPHPEEFQLVFYRAFKVLAAGAMPTVIGLMLFAGPIVHAIGGTGYEASASVLRILSIAAGVIFLGNLGGNAIIALDLQKKGLWIYAAGAIFNIITNLFFIPRYGYVAAAWTTVMTEALVTIAMFVLIWRVKAYRAARL